MADIFKKCSLCQHEWITQEDFLRDRTIKVLSYKADFMDLDFGMFFFNHITKNCGSTITLYIKDFINLYKGEKYPERRTGFPDCPGYCKNENELNRCDALCECAYAREIIHIINTYNKR